MPLGLRLQQPVLGAHLVCAFDLRWLPDTEPPVIACEVLAQLGHGPTKTQRLIEHFLQQRTASRALHHRRRHIQRGQDAVLR
ncbi:hypothetical protein D3C77_710310 [compost metagenome]